MIDPGAAIRISRQLAHPPRIPRIGRSGGGLIPDSPLSPVTGSLVADSPGRTDTINAHVPSGSYVIPADIVSHIGEGNTLSGLKVLESMFSASARNAPSTPYGATAGPWGSTMPKGVAGRPMHAPGGLIGPGGGSPTPVALAGGEFVIHPDDVKKMGGGSVDKGHKVLDHFVKAMRAQSVKTLRKLPGPAR